MEFTLFLLKIKNSGSYTITTDILTDTMQILRQVRSSLGVTNNFLDGTEITSATLDHWMFNN